MDPPSVVAVVAPQAAVVGQAFAFDASQAGGTFSDPGGRGLVPDGAGVVRATLTARDEKGRAAGTGIAIAVFMPGLGVPTLPSQPFRYAGLDLPAHFIAATPAPPPAAVSVAGADNTPVDNPITDAGATLSSRGPWCRRRRASMRRSRAGPCWT